MTAPTTPASGSSRRRVLLGSLLLILVIAGIGFAWQPATRYWRISHPAQQDLRLPADLWAMDGAKGAPLTKRNRTDADFQPVRAAFQSQIYGTYCGVASAVIALRALGDQRVSQTDFFTPKTDAIRSQHDVFYGGMTLDELGGLLEARGARVTVVHAGVSRVDFFRDEARANVEGGAGTGGAGAGGDVLLVNYLRKSIGQQRGGHVSPVVAYDSDTDRFLVLDVSTYKYPPVWVKTAALFKAMNTVDSSAKPAPNRPGTPVDPNAKTKKLTRGWLHVRLPPAS